ncbi:MAG: Bax inhibitor-1/YccA family protein [Treponema sp.]|nr:Bax inhibitor-1/YccA family protein [Treponema sp.]
MEMENEVLSQENANNSAARKFMTKVYAWMTAALVITAVSAWLPMIYEPLTRLIFGTQYIFFVLIIAELALVIVLSRAIHKLSPAAACICFIIYSVINGLTLSSIFITYKISSIYFVFFITAGMFFGMTIYGIFTKRDLTSAGRYLMMALIGIIIASLVNIFIKSQPIDWLISVIAVGVFVGLTAYDTQKLLQTAQYSDDSEAYKKVAIIGALELYLDFINLFLKLLRLFGKRK